MPGWLGTLLAEPVEALLRAYSVLTVTKAVETADERIIEGVATTPSTDRVGDIVEPMGAEFQLPIPLLLHHDSTQPIGEVFAAKQTKDGIAIKARIARIDEPGKLKDRLDEAWQSMKIGLIRGLSIGFKGLEVAEIQGTWGVRFIKWLWLELSAVTIPANQDASILAIKSADAAHLAATGNDGGRTVPGVSGQSVRRSATRMTPTERRQAFEGRRKTTVDRMEAIQNAADGRGESKNEQERDEFKTLSTELDSIDAEINDAKLLEKASAAQARPVVGGAPEVAAASREPAHVPVISVRDAQLPPGIAFTRSVMCEIQGKMDNRDPLQLAKRRYPDHTALHRYIEQKAAVPAATTTGTTWASSLVYPENLASEFIEYLLPGSVLFKFGQGNIPALTRVPFNVRVQRQISSGNAEWVGEGKAKPVTAFGFDYVTLLHDKVAAISVLAKEVIRLSTPSAEMLVRNALAKEVNKRIDISFVDPANAGTAQIKPASITNGVTPLSSAGTSSDNVITDIANILQAFIENNQETNGLVLLMPASLAMVVGLMRNSLGQRVFPDINQNGGVLEGIPVITSQHLANSSGAGNLVVAVDAPAILLADDGNVTVDMSDQASLEMSDAPTGSSATPTAASLVSLWQTNSVGLRAEREITWVKGRSTAVVYMDDVNWGSIGSPA